MAISFESHWTKRNTRMLTFSNLYFAVIAENVNMKGKTISTKAN